MGKMIYLIVFLMTFIAVTSLFLLMDTKFNNIFALDFSPAPDMREVNLNLQAEVDSLKEYYKTTKIDTFFVYMDTTLIAQLDTTKKEVTKLQNLLQENSKLISEKENEIKNITKRTVAVKDSVRAAWLKSTVKLYETMDARTAAKIIKSYPEDLAREIIYSIKKKKAGEILSQLSPEFVSKITGAN